MRLAHVIILGFINLALASCSTMINGQRYAHIGNRYSLEQNESECSIFVSKGKSPVPISGYFKLKRLGNTVFCGLNDGMYNGYYSRLSKVYTQVEGASTLREEANFKNGKIHGQRFLYDAESLSMVSSFDSGVKSGLEYLLDDGDTTEIIHYTFIPASSIEKITAGDDIPSSFDLIGELKIDGSGVYSIDRIDLLLDAVYIPTECRSRLAIIVEFYPGNKWLLYYTASGLSYSREWNEDN